MEGFSQDGMPCADKKNYFSAVKRRKLKKKNTKIYDLER